MSSMVLRNSNDKDHIRGNLAAESLNIGSGGSIVDERNGLGKT